MFTRAGELDENTKKWQGKLIEPENAVELNDEQENFLRRALGEGKIEYANFLKDPNAPNRDFFIPFSEHAHLVSIGYYFIYFNEFKTRQEVLYRYIHDNNEIPDHLKLFFEFLIGLVRFDLAAQMQYQFILSRALIEGGLEERVSPGQPLFVRLNNIGKLLTKINKIIDEKYIQIGKSEEYMLQAYQFLKCNPHLEFLSNVIVSMQSIPRHYTGLVTMAQVLHWKGWGGDGAMLREFFSEEWPDLLLNCTHYISTKRESHFKGLLTTLTTPIQSHITKVIIAFFTSKDLTEKIKFCDFGSGPSAAMVRQSIIDLQEQGKLIELDAMDICGLESNSETSFPRRTYYFDGNSNMSNFSSSPSGELYDSVSAGKVLHQLVDSKAILQSMVKWTKPNGAIFLHEIGESRNLQYAIVPINVIDREGWVPEYSFWDLSVEADEGKIKFPYPLTQVSIRSPQTLIEQGAGPAWHFHAYVVIEASSALLTELKEKHEVGLIDEADHLLEIKQGFNLTLFYRNFSLRNENIKNNASTLS